MNRKTLAGVGAVVLLSAGMLTSCSSSGSKGGSGGSSTGTTSSAAATGDTIQVKNFSFEPASLTVAKGTTVTWDFDDTTAHNVTASNGAFKSATVAKGKSYSFQFNTAGTYNYICTIHQYMKGSITVK